ncbi:DNA-binding IclR family transcriptional regulator [Mycobacterium sp. BK086]|uniref:helix-turn-helix domain-containing protein n=1 Tax=Mycobacterium sp. BK086 TaxID=2512165 RepID=UPI00105D7BC8|nr:helix-turn-helix domain-containing protein [Mycobacterium sp. BK086]TDO14861.1 DNA-binding IclR family transcriptional regulator [Mycobacterium sp. BK086]
MKGTTSAPTERVLDVVELLARPGNEQLRFSDIVRELDLTQATAHSILKTLSDRGWVTRDPAGKAFRLGPALAVVAARTDAVRPLAHAAHAAVVELSAELGYAASVVERVGDSLVITAFEGGDTGSHPPPGERIAYAPPFGVAFAAWDTPAEQTAWIARSGSANPELAERLERVLIRTRERGFDVDWTTQALGQMTQLVGALRDDVPAHVGAMLDQLLVECATIGLLPENDSAPRPQPIASICAPVFGDGGRVALILAVHPFVPLPMRRVTALGTRLVEVANYLGASGL